MNIWLIKHKGADYWGNYTLDKEIEFSDGAKIYAQNAFYRKKDALKYLKALPYPESYEAIKAVTQPTEDKR